jgi:C1A family cysteine protease
MKLFVIFIILLLNVFLNASANDSQHLEDDWHLFKHEHGKSYKGHHEENKRKRIWESNLAKIRKHNLEHQHEKHGLRLEMNNFGDMTDEEYNSMLNGYMPYANRTKEFDHHHHDLKTHKYLSSAPNQINYTALGYVTGVKNQGDCSACWIFSAVGALEGRI